MVSLSIGAGRVVATRPFKRLVSIERRGNFKGNFERSWLSELHLSRLDSSQHSNASWRTWLANPHGNLVVAGANAMEWLPMAS